MSKQNYTHIHSHLPKSLVKDLKTIAQFKGISLSEHIEQVLLGDTEHMKKLIAHDPAIDGERVAV